MAAPDPVKANNSSAPVVHGKTQTTLNGKLPLPAVTRSVAVPKQLPTFIRVFDPTQSEVIPEDFLAGAGQLLALLFAVCWLLTLAFNRKVISDNPLRDRIGYNNACVGFDTPPARYAAQIMFTACAYLCIRYALADLERTELLKDSLTPKQYTISKATDIAFVISVAIFSLVLVIPPDVSHWAHSLAFVQYSATRFCVVMANMYEYPKKLPSITKAYLVIYGAFTWLMPLFLVIDFTVYDGALAAGKTLEGPAIPVPISFITDWGWFTCLALHTKCIPRAQAIILARRVASLKYEKTTTFADTLSKE